MARQPDCPLHEGGELVGELAAYVNQVVLVPIVGLAIVLPPILHLLPNLPLSRGLVASPNVRVVRVAPGVGKAVLEEGRIPVSLQEQLCHDAL